VIKIKPVIVVQGSCQGGEILSEASFALEEEVSAILKNREILGEIARSITGESDVEVIGFREEFATTSGSIDILAIDNKSRIYIFELKRGHKSDTEWDRRALAQLLEYAAAVYEDYSQNPESFVEKLGLELEDAISQELANILETGEYFLIVAAPDMPDRLKRAMSYLVAISGGSLKLFGVIARKYESGACRILELLVTSSLLMPKTQEKKIWTENDVIRFINSLENEELKRRLLRIIEVLKKANMGDIGGRNKNPLIRVRVKMEDKSVIILTFDAGNGSAFAYIGLRDEKDPRARRLKERVYQELMRLELIEPGIDVREIPSGRNLKATIGELSEEKFEKLLDLIKNLGSGANF